MRRRTTKRWTRRLAVTAALGAFAPAVLTASAASTPQGETRLVVPYRVTSNEQVGAQRFITLAGTGRSAALGKTEAASSVVITPGPGCYPRSADDVWSTKAGTLRVHSEGEVCQSGISGTWTVTDGTGSFAGSTGGGRYTAHGSGLGRIVVRYEGRIRD